MVVAECQKCDVACTDGHCIRAIVLIRIGSRTIVHTPIPVSGLADSASAILLPPTMAATNSSSH